MKLSCPECNADIPSENINIQKMVAVCPNCGAVFSFDTPDTLQAKVKRRKAYQPSAMTVEETDEHLDMAFRTNFRLSQDGGFVGGIIMSVIFSFLTLTFISTGKVPFFITAGFGLVALCTFYWLASLVFNKTHITMTADKITISRKPLPDQSIEVSLSGVTEFRFEETAISQKESYDLPRYNVWAETVDGRRRTIVKDVIEDYAVYIAQRLNEQLNSGVDTEASGVGESVNVSRLVDEAKAHDTEDADAFAAMNQMSANRRS